MTPRPDLRLLVITDRQLAAPRNVIDLVAACLQAGAPAIQLRDKSATASEQLELAAALLPLVRRAGALLIINDRLDLALACGAHGVHLGPDDLPVAAARRIVPPDFLIGYSTDSPELARAAVAAGANYIGCGAIFGTRNKQGLEHERIGPEGLARVVAAVDVPVLGIGGIDADNVHAVAEAGAAGAAVIGAIMRADDPAGVARKLLAAFG